LKEGRIKVMGKGSKERYVPVTSETAGVVWQYLASRPDPKPRYRDFVFLSCTGRSLSTDAVGNLIRELGKKIGVRAYPHKFRHTGATEFIKNGGSALALKDILGHSTMTMVNRYVHLAQVDIEEAHRNASPVYN
jgi:integrase/recombinase XerD